MIAVLSNPLLSIKTNEYYLVYFCGYEQLLLQDKKKIPDQDKIPSCVHVKYYIIYLHIYSTSQKLSGVKLILFDNSFAQAPDALYSVFVAQC